MKTAITILSTIVLLSMTASAYAEIPSWVKSNAGWWADGTITDSEFISGVEFLINDGIIVVPQTTVASQSDDAIPSWVKSNAGWWADGTISDGEFVNAIQHLMKSGLISVMTDSKLAETVSSETVSVESDDSVLASLEAELDKCSEISKAYKRIDCQKPIEKAMLLHDYKTNSQQIELGPITYYWFGVGSQGNEFYITPTGQPILSIRMLAENTSPDVTAINCTSPSICAYDVWDGSKAFKYSGMDFTSGQIVLNPEDSKEFNILFGPNIGYGGTEFEYDSAKNYFFRINENFGSIDIPLELE